MRSTVARRLQRIAGPAAVPPPVRMTSPVADASRASFLRDKLEVLVVDSLSSCRINRVAFHRYDVAGSGDVNRYFVRFHGQIRIAESAGWS